jgi:hypothetical protein
MSRGGAGKLSPILPDLPIFLTRQEPRLPFASWLGGSLALPFRRHSLLEWLLAATPQGRALVGMASSRA